MEKNSLYRKISNYLIVTKTCLSEGKETKDKWILTKYFLKFPLHFLNHLIGKKNNKKLSSEVFIKNEYGIFNCGDNFSSVFGFSSLNEPEVRKELLKIKEGTIVDIGANGGMHTIPLAGGMGRREKVLAIEPETKNFEILKKNIELNNLTNVIPVRKGCFSKKQKLRFYLDEVGTGGHSLKKIQKNFIEIEVDTLDNIVKENKIKDIKLIKIDVEGAEADVLIGAKEVLKEYHPEIIFEAWSDEHFEKIKAILDKYNYRYEKIGTQDYKAF